ncbi:MAG: energy transducer TonB [Puniceicoccaceae bacterium]
MPNGNNRLVGYKVPRSNKYVIRIVIATIIMTLAILAILPFTQALSGDPRDRNLRSVDVANLPPPEPPPPEPPPPPEEEEEEEIEDFEEPPPPLDLSQLEAALNPGTGNAMAGAFGFGGFAVRPDSLSEMQIFEIKDLDSRPKRLKAVAPVYPMELQRAGIEGTVRVRILIDQAGSVRVLEFVDVVDRRFIEPVTDAVERWQFEAPMKDGKPVQAAYILPLPFQL